MSSNKFFATAAPRRLFFKVAMPGMISMLAASLYSIMEGVFIGHTLGEAAFAAINIAMPFTFINFSLADLIGVGSSVPISIALGRKEGDRANNYFTCSLILILLAAVLMGFILYLGSPALVGLMGARGQLAQLAVRYIRIFALMGPLSTVVFAMDNYLRICGFVKGSMLLNVFMSLLTIALLFIFLTVCGMNVEGSALAVSGAMAVCAVIAFVPFVCCKTILRMVKPHFSLSMIREIVLCGTPVFLNNIAGRVAAIVINGVLLHMGGQTAVAAYSVLMYAGGVIEPMLYGMSDSVQPAIGYNWGAKSLDRVRDIAKCSFTACGVISVIGAVVMLFFARPLVGLFVNADDVTLIDMSTRAMMLFSTAYLTRWVGFVVQGFFSAIGKPLPATLLSISGALIFPILFIVLMWRLSLDGLWLNMSATSLAVAIMAVVLILRYQKNMRCDIQKESVI